MIDFESSDGLEDCIGAEFEVVTHICRGDIIAIEPSGPKKFVLRALSEDEIKEYKGPKYRVDKGKEPGTVILTSG